jgi:hypothetical protein
MLLIVRCVARQILRSHLLISHIYEVSRTFRFDRTICLIGPGLQFQQELISLRPGRFPPRQDCQISFYSLFFPALHIVAL